jgi:hypothetical protein
MTTITEVQDLAAELQDLRPDWPDIIPIVNHLLPWRHLPYDQLHDLTVAWVKNHGNRTPASLKYMPGVPVKQAGDDVSPRKTKQHACYICGKSKYDCQRQHDWEISNDIPDPHVFETEEQATANKAERTPAQRAELNARIRTLFRRVDDELAKPTREPYLPPDLLAESQARLELDEQRPEVSQPA